MQTIFMRSKVWLVYMASLRNNGPRRQLCWKECTTGHSTVSAPSCNPLKMGIVPRIVLQDCRIEIAASAYSDASMFIKEWFEKARGEKETLSSSMFLLKWQLHIGVFYICNEKPRDHTGMATEVFIIYILIDKCLRGCSLKEKVKA